MQPRAYSIDDLRGGLGRLGVTVALDDRGRWYAQAAAGGRVPVLSDPAISDTVPGMHVVFLAEELGLELGDIMSEIQQYRALGDA